MAKEKNPIDEYLARVDSSQRAALQALCKSIRTAAPNAEVGVSYGLPAYFSDGKPLVAFSASAKHCSLFPMNGSTVAAFQKELEGFETSKGTIRFTVDKPLPAGIVRKIVKARLAENSAKALTARKPKTDSADDPKVAEFLENLKHPLKKEVETVRRIIRGVHREIREGIKWNAPSFRTREWFATLNLRDGRVWLILHTGAKAKGKDVQRGLKDPAGILKWLGADRALVTFDDGKEVTKKKKALQAIIKQWVSFV